MRWRHVFLDGVGEGGVQVLGYKLADAIVDSALRIPGMGKLVRQKAPPLVD